MRTKYGGGGGGGGGEGVYIWGVESFVEGRGGGKLESFGKEGSPLSACPSNVGGSFSTQSIGVLLNL